MVSLLHVVRIDGVPEKNTLLCVVVSLFSAAEVDAGHWLRACEELIAVGCQSIRSVVCKWYGLISDILMASVTLIESHDV